MFSKCEGKTISFPSSWKTERTVSTNSTQTADLLTNDVECQVNEPSEVSIQTDEEEVIHNQSPEYSESSLLEFLQRITPHVEKELDRANRSRAFLGYSDLDESNIFNAKFLHTLRWKQVLSEHIVTDVGWSCTGSVIGISYGVGLHEDWCSHKGFIAFWNINRSDFAVNAPEQVMESSTCIMCLAFHPSNPALVAAGNMSGEVLIYDLSKSQEATLITSGDSGGLTITCISWFSSLLREDHYTKASPALITATSSGTILVWNFNHNKENVALKFGFLVESQDVPREVRSHLSDTAGGIGLTSLTFCNDDSSTFLLGTESGAVLLCTGSSKDYSNTHLGETSLMKCVTSSLAQHVGKILRVCFSPFHRHAVHTLGTDNNLRIYSVLQNKPLQVIYSEVAVTCSEWSTSRPLVIAVGKVNGVVSFYDFDNKSSEPILNLDAAEKPSPISSLRFNRKNMNLISVGDQLGRVFIWELPDFVVSPTSTELTSLGKKLQILNEG